MNTNTKVYLVIIPILFIMLVLSVAAYYAVGKTLFMLILILIQAAVIGFSTGVWAAKELKL